MARVQAIVVRDGQVLMVRHRFEGREYWCLPGGGLEAGETPEQGVLRELGEECNVRGTVVRQTCYAQDPYAQGAHSFLVDIGDQTPSLGHDPELAEGREVPILIDMQWLRLSEIPERDRAFLWGAGLLGVEGFPAEVESWGDDMSYPGETQQ
jgi:8-oxo-dGTP diphosphatase